MPSLRFTATFQVAIPDNLAPQIPESPEVKYLPDSFEPYLDQNGAPAVCED